MDENKKEKKHLNGEFIPSYYGWVDLDKQKEIVRRLENITNKK